MLLTKFVQIVPLEGIALSTIVRAIASCYSFLLLEAIAKCDCYFLLLPVRGRKLCYCNGILKIFKNHPLKVLDKIKLY